MRFDSLQAWLNWLETLHPTEIDLGLERIGQVAQNLRLSKPAKQVITVAGTNGKGSTVAFLSTVLKEAGLRVGSYTSPHLITYNERVVIDGKMVSDAQLCEAFEQVEHSRGDISLTYFEFGTLAAFVLFEKANLDVAVLEVGLGGRLDAVNLVDADVAIITTIALDHEAWLGNTREAIGKEKAGILRKGKPAVAGDKALPSSVIEAAQHIGATLLRRDVDFTVENISSKWCWRGVDVNNQTVSIDELPLPQLPLDNAATAIQALMCLPMAIPHEAISKGIREATLIGRYQKITEGVLHILDVAHNPESAQYLAQKLQQDRITGKTIAVFAMLADKDCQQVITLLKDSIDQWYVGGIDVARGQSAKKMAEMLGAAGITHVCSCDTIDDAYEQAVATATVMDRILVCGSFYTVGAVLSKIKQH